jgi:hypothetical protein
MFVLRFLSLIKIPTVPIILRTGGVSGRPLQADGPGSMAIDTTPMHGLRKCKPSVIPTRRIPRPNNERKVDVVVRGVRM